MAAAEHKEKAHGTDPTFPLNRAAAYLKLNKNEDAERDCSITLKLQPNNVKALFRRAQARVALGKLSDARADLVAAAKAEPGNTAVRAEFTKVEGLIGEEAKKAKAGKGIPISLPTHAPAPSDPSGPPYRRRVPIAIVNDDEPEENKEAEAAKPKTTPSRTIAPPKSILKNATVSSDHQPGDLPTVSKPDTFLTPVSTRSLSSSGLPSQKDPAPVPAHVPSSATLAGPSPPPISPGKPAASPAVVTAAAPEPAATAPLPNKGSEEPSSAFPLQPDSAPPTLLVFLQKWSNTRTDADRASVLFAVPPSSIPSLFGPTLESPLLGAMLSALSWALASAANLPTADIPRRTLAYMSALAQVPRFSTIMLFLDVAEKKYAKDVWDGLEQSGVEADIGKEKKKWAC
ncbi:unnamed protein product [Rhizoctonia solani]|uniref:RNA polymerase II-associated protein 3 n=1 Tax=Rhizoctonia solani TaxID=456999 RepID=A0A8H3BKR4_9AGAM|nr:unnamed protein product [Rhizoctonia solani]